MLNTQKNSPRPQPLTLKEKRVLEFLEAYIRREGVAPTYQEIRQAFGLASFNSVQRYLKQLMGKGYIHTPSGSQKRAISLLQSSAANQQAVAKINTPSPTALSLPLLGKVAAGRPIEATENDEFIDVPASLVRYADRTFALRVQGQSMIEDGIFEGDVLLVQKQARAENGEIVVAVIHDEATVKRFYMHRTQQSVELRPANASMQSMWFDPTEVQIRGVVVGLIRQF